MKDNSYITIDGVKYYISFVNRELKVYKIVNNTKVEASKEEYDKIKSEVYKDDTVFYQEGATYLELLVEQNETIKEKLAFKLLLSWIDDILPEEKKSDFYEKVRTLEVIEDPENKLFKKLMEKNSSSTHLIPGAYIANYNALIINRVALDIFKENGEETEYYKSVYYNTLIHELLHMASSGKEENDRMTCGFSILPPKIDEDINMGLTEAYTQFLANMAIPGIGGIGTYDTEIALLEQLMLIINPEVIYKSYFLNLGTTQIEKELDYYCPEPDKSYDLMRQMEYSYVFIRKSKDTSILYGVQDILLDYLKSKGELLIQYEKPEEVEALLTKYEKALITRSKGEYYGSEIVSHPYIEYNESKFNSIKEKLLQELGDTPKTL